LLGGSNLDSDYLSLFDLPDVSICNYRSVIAHFPKALIRKIKNDRRPKNFDNEFLNVHVARMHPTYKKGNSRHGWPSIKLKKQVQCLLDHLVGGLDSIPQQGHQIRKVALLHLQKEKSCYSRSFSLCILHRGVFKDDQNRAWQCARLYRYYRIGE
jgi:hypothetical protein